MEEGVHYEIIPDRKDEQAWNVRILAGPLTETGLKYGVIKYNEIPKKMSFNFSIINSPDTELTVEDLRLQDSAGAVLEKIMENGMKDGSVVNKEIEHGN